MRVVWGQPMHVGMWSFNIMSVDDGDAYCGRINENIYLFVYVQTLKSLW